MAASNYYLSLDSLMRIKWLRQFLKALTGRSMGQHNGIVMDSMGPLTVNGPLLSMRDDPLYRGEFRLARLSAAAAPRLRPPASISISPVSNCGMAAVVVLPINGREKHLAISRQDCALDPTGSPHRCVRLPRRPRSGGRV